jgi:hypothetical protein
MGPAIAAMYNGDSPTPPDSPKSAPASARALARDDNGCDLSVYPWIKNLLDTVLGMSLYPWIQIRVALDIRGYF